MVTLSERVIELAKAIGGQFKQIRQNIGSVADLQTADKSSLVAAINEARTSGGSSGAAIDDTAAAADKAYSSQKTAELISAAKTDLKNELTNGADALSARWDELYAGRLSPEAFRELSADTRSFLAAVADGSRVTSAQLHEIMMAQDFQDLTGQVIKRVVDLAHLLETQLLQVLLEAAPPQVRSEHHSGLLNGPVINPEGRTDVLSNQAQVDDLLESLGF